LKPEFVQERLKTISFLFHLLFFVGSNEYKSNFFRVISKTNEAQTSGLFELRYMFLGIIK